MKIRSLLASMAVAGLLLGAGASAWGHDADHEGTCPPITQAIAVIHPTTGNTVHGIVRFTQDGKESVKVVADLSRLPPSSTHGFHIHQYGDCSAADATSAGGHYNPESHQHAAPTVENRHAGDLGNITADAQGNAHLEIVLDDMSICCGENPILGRAVIVHRDPDDLKSQPTGNAGPRIGCGVIGVASPPAAPK